MRVFCSPAWLQGAFRHKPRTELQLTQKLKRAQCRICRKTCRIQKKLQLHRLLMGWWKVPSMQGKMRSTLFISRAHIWRLPERRGSYSLLSSRSWELMWSRLLLKTRREAGKNGNCRSRQTIFIYLKRNIQEMPILGHIVQ